MTPFLNTQDETLFRFARSAFNYGLPLSNQYSMGHIRRTNSLAFSSRIVHFSKMIHFSHHLFLLLLRLFPLPKMELLIQVPLSFKPKTTSQPISRITLVFFSSPPILLLTTPLAQISIIFSNKLQPSAKSAVVVRLSPLPPLDLASLNHAKFLANYLGPRHFCWKE